MIKRFYKTVWANVSGFIRQEKDGSNDDSGFEGQEFSQHQPLDNARGFKSDPLAGYYANLELSPGAGRDEIKRAWKKLLKQYHPDLHSKDPEKRKIATELTGCLNQAYRILDKELSKKGFS